MKVKTVADVTRLFAEASPALRAKRKAAREANDVFWEHHNALEASVKPFASFLCKHLRLTHKIHASVRVRVASSGTDEVPQIELFWHGYAGSVDMRVESENMTKNGLEKWLAAFVSSVKEMQKLSPEVPACTSN